jgi:integrase/recombinase XerD
MFREWKLAPNTVTQRVAALRFFYVQVLKRGWRVAATPYPKKVLHLPEILSQEEVARVIDAVVSLPAHPNFDALHVTVSWLPPRVP